MKYNYKDDFERYLLTEKRVSANTFDAYTRDLTQFIQFLERSEYEIDMISTKELKEFLVDLRRQALSASSVSRKISCLKTFFLYLNERHGIKNHADALIFPRLEKKLPQFLSEEDIERLFACAQKETTDAYQRNYVMLYLLYATGMRVSELTTLTLNALDFESGFIKIRGKGGKDRIIPLAQEVQLLLKEYLQHILPLFINKTHGIMNKTLFPTFYNGQLKPMTRQAFWSYIKEIAGKSGITHDLSPHHIRHSLATHLLQKGAHLRSIQLMLGHENLKTVQIYTHVETSHLRKIYDAKHPRA